MDGFTQPLWPVHPKPYADELLSSWLVRIAHGHGLKVQSFCNLVFGGHRQVWNRDIDRLAPAWLVQEICTHTGVTWERGMATTLRTYEGFLYPRFRTSGLLRWILPLKMYHRKRNGHGLQFCPECLSRDKEPYFRRRWRVGFYVFCSRHNCMLHDRCPNCGAPVAFHRLEMGKPNTTEAGPMCCCHECGFDFRLAGRSKPVPYDKATHELLRGAMRILEGRPPKGGPAIDEGFLGVLHQLCRLMTTRYESVTLREFVLEELRVRDMPLPGSRVSPVMRPLAERFHLLQLAGWLLVDPRRRLSFAWQAKAVRYNVLLRDFGGAPAWYEQIVGIFSDWRNAEYIVFNSHQG